MDGVKIVQQVIPHFWPEQIEEFFVFNFNNYGFLTFNEICRKYEQN